MRILQIHNYYSKPGGEDKVLEEEKKLLTLNGHEVTQWTKSNIGLNTFELFNLFASTHWSRKSIRECSTYFKNKSFDIVHVHNFFPQFSPSIFKFFRENSIPSVMTLHNYRLIYPNGYLFQDKIDHTTIKGSAYKLIRKKTYRNSYIQTAIVAHMIEFNRKHKTWEKYVDRLICLTNFQKNILSQAGLPESKMVVKPNFINLSDDIIKDKSLKENYFIFVGRLSQEKGIIQLLEAWKNLKIPYNLKVFGGGPLKERVQGLASTLENVDYYGELANNIVLRHLVNARALILPSLWYEGFPMTILEANSLKVPVIATKIGGQNEIVIENITGCKYALNNSNELFNQIERIAENDDFHAYLANNAYKRVIKEYSSIKNYESLINIYRSAIDFCLNN